MNIKLRKNSRVVLEHDPTADVGTIQPAAPRPRLLFIAPLPEPITGQALACQVLLNTAREFFDIEVVNTNKPRFKSGLTSGQRVVDVARLLLQVWRKQEQVDLIYFNNSQSLAGHLKDLLLYLGCWRNLKKMVVHLHGGAGMRVLMRGRLGLLRRISAPFLHRMAALVVLGPRHLDVYGAAAPQSSLRMVPNFAEDHLFLAESQILNKFQNLSPVRLLFLSNLLPGKGHLELVEAYARLDAAEQAQLRIDVAGGFESEAIKRDFLQRIAVLPSIQYHGTVRGQAKEALFHQAHVFCLPTYYPYEGQPISILEAYASGCVVVTTDHSGIFDTFADGENGFSVEKRSVPSLVAVLRKTLESRSRLADIATLNRGLAERQYTVHAFDLRMMSIFRDVSPPLSQK